MDCRFIHKELILGKDLFTADIFSKNGCDPSSGLKKQTFGQLRFLFVLVAVLSPYNHPNSLMSILLAFDGDHTSLL